MIGRVLGSPTTVIVPVPEVGDLTPRPPTQLPPHVTVLYPFVRRRRLSQRVVAEVRAIAAAARPFSFALTRVGRFPGVLYLAPEPAVPFVELTQACVARWPRHQPYGGAFAQIVPHVTLAYDPEPPDLAMRARARLPVQCQATEMWLCERRGLDWHHTPLPFGVV